LGSFYYSLSNSPCLNTSLHKAPKLFQLHFLLKFISYLILKGELWINKSQNTLNTPGYILDIRSTRPLSNPAITAPPTGTRKFLSVLCTKASTLPFLKIKHTCWS
jgi:hypothetical protein